jgi:hypothetical protein
MEQTLLHFRECKHIIVSSGTQGTIKCASEALPSQNLEQGAFQFRGILTDLFEDTVVGGPPSILAPSGTGGNGFGDFLARLLNLIDQQ